VQQCLPKNKILYVVNYILKLVAANRFGLMHLFKSNISSREQKYYISTFFARLIVLYICSTRIINVNKLTIFE